MSLEEGGDSSEEFALTANKHSQLPTPPRRGGCLQGSISKDRKKKQTRIQPLE